MHVLSSHELNYSLKSKVTHFTYRLKMSTEQKAQYIRHDITKILNLKHVFFDKVPQDRYANYAFHRARIK